MKKITFFALLNIGYFGAISLGCFNIGLLPILIGVLSGVAGGVSKFVGTFVLLAKLSVLIKFIVVSGTFLINLLIINKKKKTLNI